VSAVMNLGVPRNAGNFLTSCKPVSFSRRTLHHAVSKCGHCPLFRPKYMFRRLDPSPSSGVKWAEGTYAGCAVERADLF